MKYILRFFILVTIAGLMISLTSCGNGGSALNNSAAEKVFVAPGEHDEFYAFMSGGFSG